MPNPIETTTIDGIPLTTIQTAAEDYIEGFKAGFAQTSTIFAVVGSTALVVAVAGVVALTQRHDRKKRQQILDNHQKINTPS